MSYYYHYYLGYKKEEKIYPLGPFDDKGRLKPVLTRSNSFASDLYELFYDISEEEVSDELRKKFERKDIYGKTHLPVKKLMLSKLPSGSYIRTGYFLIEDVVAYEETWDSYGLFYDRKTPLIYSAMVNNEVLLGAPQPKNDCEGNPIEVHGAADYMFYAFPDYFSKLYEASVIRLFAEALESYEEVTYKDIVVIETEG